MGRFCVDTAIITPTVIDRLTLEDVPNLKTLALGGKAVSLRYVEKWRSISLYGIYGPAEFSICAWNEQMGEFGNPTNIERAFWVTDPPIPGNCYL